MKKSSILFFIFLYPLITLYSDDIFINEMFVLDPSGSYEISLKLYYSEEEENLRLNTSNIDANFIIIFSLSDIDRINNFMRISKVNIDNKIQRYSSILDQEIFELDGFLDFAGTGYIHIEDPVKVKLVRDSDYQGRKKITFRFISEFYGKDQYDNDAVSWFEGFSIYYDDMNFDIFVNYFDRKQIIDRIESE